MTTPQAGRRLHLPGDDGTLSSPACARVNAPIIRRDATFSTIHNHYYYCLSFDQSEES